MDHPNIPAARGWQEQFVALATRELFTNQPAHMTQHIQASVFVGLGAAGYGKLYVSIDYLLLTPT